MKISFKKPPFLARNFFYKSFFVNAMGGKLFSRITFGVALFHRKSDPILKMRTNFVKN